jgi:hypothetical protein
MSALAPAALREFLAAGEALEFTVTGGSMGRALPAGSIVRVHGRPPRLGELALYDCGDGSAVHRIVWRRRELRYQIGDAEPGGTWLAPEKILGTVGARKLPGAPDWTRESRPLRLLRLLRALGKLLLRKFRGAGRR